MPVISAMPHGLSSLTLREKEMSIRICTTQAISSDLNQICSGSNRAISDVIKFFIRKSEKELGWSIIASYKLPIENWYDTPPIRTRLPRPWYLSIHDLAWKYQISFARQGARAGGAGYLIGICCMLQLKKHTVPTWINFFTSGNDIMETLGAAIDERLKDAHTI